MDQLNPTNQQSGLEGLWGYYSDKDLLVVGFDLSTVARMMRLGESR